MMADMGNMFSINTYIERQKNHKPDESLIETDLNINSEDIQLQYSNHDVQEALEWSKTTGYPIIVPTQNLSDLEDLMTDFESYPDHVKKASDEISIQYFGVPNDIHYEWLKKYFLDSEVSDREEVVESVMIADPVKNHIAFGMNEDVSAIDKAYDLINLTSVKTESYETAIRKDVVDKVTGEYVASNQNLRFDTVPYEDLPFLTPEEIIDAGVNSANPEDNFYGVEPIAHMDTGSVMAEDGNTSDWINDYQNACNGFPGTYDPIKWKEAIAKLELMKRFNPDKEFSINQSMLSLGWPAEADFSPENRVKAAKRIKAKMADKSGSYQFVDLTKMEVLDDDIDEAAVSLDDNILKPVYIILQQGHSAIAKAIKHFTNSIYTHASISFDRDLKDAYSYNGMIKDKINGGLVKEDIRNMDVNKNDKIEINVIFLKNKDWDKLKSNIEDFVANSKKTSYGYINLIIAHIFKIPMKNNKRHLVCSEFVDKILKLGDIDVSNKDSSLVSPADLDKYAKENKKIYTVFDDIYANFNPRRIKNLVTRLSKKAEPIKENENTRTSKYIFASLSECGYNFSAVQDICSQINEAYLDKEQKKIYETFFKPMLYAEDVFGEAKTLPVKFDKEGNLFIKNMKRKDYEAEYAKSHRLLKQYEQSGNYESMKYELCRLWAMNIAIEENIYNDKPDSKEMKARARILNDFNKYMKVVLAEDREFNFQEYFEKSQFSDAVIMINRETIDWSTKILSSLLKNI